MGKEDKKEPRVKVKVDKTEISTTGTKFGDKYDAEGNLKKVQPKATKKSQRDEDIDAAAKEAVKYGEAQNKKQQDNK